MKLRATIVGEWEVPEEDFPHYCAKDGTLPTTIEEVARNQQYMHDEGWTGALDLLGIASSVQVKIEGLGGTGEPGPVQQLGELADWLEGLGTEILGYKELYSLEGAQEVLAASAEGAKRLRDLRVVFNSLQEQLEEFRKRKA